MKIQDKRVVVTGAASGIGLALCEEFHSSGAQSIVCVDMNDSGAKEIAEKVNG
ncbi:SDR family NAD(P)-dependent oxidoreductase, partial [Gammaproteobacteria bacterium]|nr:SDR family NAD(P)-dependent oxidoreductase [Gammaproteobacteria bacterium]